MDFSILRESLRTTAIANGLFDSNATPVIVVSSPFATTLTDLQLIDLMLVNHAEAIAIANEGLGNATDSQVRRIALRVAESQAGEIQVLRSWRHAWYPDAAALAIVPNSILDDVPVGAGYDQAFLEQIVSKLRVGIEIANVATSQAEHDQLRAYAHNIAEARRSDVHLIESWLDTHAFNSVEVVVARAAK